MKISFKRVISTVLALILISSCFSVSALEMYLGDRVHLPGLETPIDETKLVKNGTLVIEAEDILIENESNSIVVSQEKASGGKAVQMPSTQWYIEQIPGDELYTKIYVDNLADTGNYRVWYRARCTHNESASFWINPNSGVWAATFYNSSKSGDFYWASVNMTLNMGENFLAFRTRTTGYMDKIIVTNDMAFTPVGMDDVPIFMTEEEKEALWRTYWEEPPIKPIEGHPRLLVTSVNIDEMKERLNGNWRYERYKEYAYEDINCKLDPTKANNHNATLLAKIMSRALVWVLGDETDSSHARATINHMKDYLETVRTPDDAGDITRSRGHILYTAAIVYDWLYDALTEKDKEELIDYMITVVLSKEVGWPPTKGSDITTHTGEQEIFRDLMGAGIAIYDEYPLLYDLAAGRMFERMIPSRKFMRQAGKVEYGNDYALARGFSEVWADWHFMAMGYDSIYGDVTTDWWRWRIRTRMPYGSMFPDGDMFSLTRTKFTTYYIDYGLAVGIASNLYNDPYLTQEWRRNQTIWSGSTYDAFFIMLFDNDKNEMKIWDDMPLSTLNKYPQSGFSARTSWQEGFDSNAAAAYIDMHEIWVGDHQMQYTGDFQIYYKGLLAMNTGTYNASNQHNEGYSHRAIAANTMLVYDPNETFKAGWQPDILKVANDGGQRTPEHGPDSSVKNFTELELGSDGMVHNEELVVAKNIKSYTGPNIDTPEFTYITGDLAPAYTDKVAKYHRSMAFVDLDNDEYPAAFIVYDDIEASNKSFKKTWLLHSEEKPEIKGNTTVIERTGNGFGGRLVNKTLTPARSNIELKVVGGENGEMFKVGTNTNAPKSNAIEGGNYRIELSPKKEAKSDKFLNAMFVTDAGNTKELPMKKIDQSQFTGVSVMDKYVFFQKYSELAKGKFTLSLRNNDYKNISVMIGGVAPGIWQVTGGGKTQNIEVVAGSEVLVFKGASGNYTIAPASEGVKSDSIIYPKMQKKLIGDFYVWKDDSTSTDSRDGNYLYLKHPSKRIDDKPYIAVDMLAYFDASVSISGNSAIIISGDNQAVYSTDNILKLIDNTLYINPQEVAELLGYKFTWNKYHNVLSVSKNE